MSVRNLQLLQQDDNGDWIPLITVTGPNQSGYILQIQSDGTIGSVPTGTIASAATTDALGVVIVPTAGNLAVDADGNISVPLATASVFGVVKVDNVTISASTGIISATNLAPPIATSGSGSGVTVNYAGKLGRQILKITMTYAAFTAAAKTKSLTIATVPAKTRIVGCIADITIAFTGGGESAATLAVGLTTGDQIILAADVLTAAATYGLADSDLGANFARADAIQGGYVPSWSASEAITATLVTTTNNISSLTAGSVTFYLITESM